MNSTLLLLIILILASGAFSGAEIALTALSEAKVRSLTGDGRFGSRAILSLKRKPQQVLITVLVGNQVINILATVLATIWGITAFGEQNLSWVTFFFTIVLILFGSLSPKSIALKFPEHFARSLAYPLLVFYYLARPIIYIFELLTKGFLMLLRVDKKELPSSSQSEIAAMLDISAERGIIDAEEDVFMKQIMKFSETEVEEIMTVLKDIDAIDIDINLDDLMTYMVEHDHTHFPVFQEDLNNIKTIVSAHDLTRMIYHTRKKYPLHHHRFKTPIVVPKTASLTELFKEFKEKKQRMAVVIDEHGQTIGLVSLDDILEEIAGTRLDPDAAKEEPQINKIDRNTWETDGEVAISKINETMKLELKYPEHKVISLVILEELKRFPEEEEKIDLDGIDVEIQRIDKNIIKKVLLKKQRKSKKGKGH